MGQIMRTLQQGSSVTVSTHIHSQVTLCVTSSKHYIFCSFSL